MFSKNYQTIIQRLSMELPLYDSHEEFFHSQNTQVSNFSQVEMIPAERHRLQIINFQILIGIRAKRRDELGGVSCKVLIDLGGPISLWVWVPSLQLWTLVNHSLHQGNVPIVIRYRTHQVTVSRRIPTDLFSSPLYSSSILLIWRID